MAEIRLNKLIKQFNIGLDTLVDYLNSLGAGFDNPSPNSKVSDMYLPALHKKFGKDLERKEVAEKVDVKLTEILERATMKSSGTPKEAEVSTESGIRLGKIIKDLNIGLGTLVDYLNGLGLEMDMNPNAKVPVSYMPNILWKFGHEIKETEVAKPPFANDEYWDATPDPSIEDFRSIWLKPTVRLSKLMRRYQVGLGELVQQITNLGVEMKEPGPASTVDVDMIPKLDKVMEVMNEDLDGIELKVPTSTETVSRDKVASDNTAEQSAMERQTQDTRTPSLNANLAPEEFDWDAFEAEAVPGESREEIAALFDQTRQKVIENEVVEGIVTAINKREVVVNIGARTEGVISAPEFRYNPDLKVGDKVEVLVESAEDRKGQLVISHKKARRLKSWDLVTKAYESGEVVKGYIKTRTKGGMIVDVFGIEAFLPGSQIDTKPVKDFDVFVDTTMDFKIIKLNPEFRNVVVSHKVILEATRNDSGNQREMEPRMSPIQEFDPLTFFSEKAQKLLFHNQKQEE